ncbi:bifunctional 2-polyprenyl-6-hydroxyphenol methylase/3-demethylubiquinol 3-O-methyltransferase UbiG [Actinomadura sp. WMMA1423]|uniref:class I SAM-dependent methyltransferase n=1 Tax=Actinomadura sp. WMMA1423 TaxID=2591108 RepID=UPI00143CE502|nr:class I SAM-dependent methyltransferase [Actinomadura sp. WMMA1423]
MGTVVRCLGCSLVSMVGGDGDLVRCAYDEDYYRRAGAPGPGYGDYFGAEAEARRQISSTLADVVLALAPVAQRVLDLGCGGGFLVNELAKRGIAATGVDGSRHVIERARESVGGGSFLHADIGAPCVAARASFDVITMIDVIEHLPDPVAALRQAASLAAPGGVIVLLTPRYGDRLLAEQGAAYVHFNSDHMYYFTEETLRAVIAQGTGQCTIDVEDVLVLAREREVDVPASMARKYTVERESMLAVVRL